MGVEEKSSFDWGIILSILSSVGLGTGLFLFIHNNALLADRARNLWHVESLVMLGVIGIPFVLILLHLVRAFKSLRQQL